MVAWYDRSIHVHTLAVATSGGKNIKENTNRAARCYALESVRGGNQCQLTVAGTHRLRFCRDWSVELAMGWRVVAAKEAAQTGLIERF